ncbi:MAG: glycine dehydrogenase, partial [Deltaproteobacteria bacterium]|nr:glycine dehydrogenase [Deltaproteobacteria bacterium]
LGKEGLRDLAKINYNRTRYAIDKISGVKSLKIRYPSPVYNEFVIDLPIKSELFLSKLKTEGILAGIRLSRFLPEEQNAILFNITEANSLDEIELFLELLHKEFSK